VIFKEDFADPKSGWDAGSDASSAVGYRSGAYFIKIKKPHHSYAAVAPSRLAPKNVAIEVTAQNVTNRSDTFFGPLCRTHGKGTHLTGYGFGIYNDGTFGIVRVDPSRRVTLAESNSPIIPR